jgi:hypothetical protein
MQEDRRAFKVEQFSDSGPFFQNGRGVFESGHDQITACTFSDLCFKIYWVRGGQALPLQRAKGDGDYQNTAEVTYF